MEQQQKEENPMYEKRNEEVILPKDGKLTTRIARFLEPFARTIDQVVGIPETPLLADIFGHNNLQTWPIKVHFTGWNKPQKDWKKWYNRLLINHGSTWIHAGILDGIQASLHEIRCNKDLVLGVSEFWCPKTNTFIFRWGEATITLEDVMILGGFPVIGAPMNQPIEGEQLRVVEGLRRAIRATHSTWMKNFMEEVEEGEIEHEEGEFEHVAFLCLWLSRFVLPVDNDEGIIGENLNVNVIPIATHLSQGTPIALAPVVLANLYHDLTYLNKMAIDPDGKSNVYVSGLFHIVQLWVCERFPGFGANLAKPLKLGYPRVSRWEEVDFDVTLPLVRSRLKEGDDFQWRPYACDAEEWVHLLFYEEKEQIISNCSVLDDCLLSFGRFLHSSELIGIGCKEMYRPNRVAMQFGYDQEIPSQYGVPSTSSWEKLGLYVPSRAFEPGVSRTYYDWWKDCMLHREEASSRDQNGGKRLVMGQLSEENPHNEKENKHMLEVPPGELEKSAQYHVNMEPSKIQSDEDDVSSDLDNVPLSLRLCSKRAIISSLAAPKPQCLSDPNPVSMSSDSLDLDNVPLALRIQSIAGKKETPCIPSESYASTGYLGNPPQRMKSYDQTEELGSPTSVANSQITQRKNSTGKTAKHGLEARVTKLERVVSALEANKFGHTHFADCD